MFVENDSPLHREFYYHGAGKKQIASHCNYIQQNNQGNIIRYFPTPIRPGTFSISDSNFILNPNYQSVDATHIFNCNINGIIYNEGSQVGRKEIVYNDLPIVCYSYPAHEQCKKITRIRLRRTSIKAYIALMRK